MPSGDDRISPEDKAAIDRLLDISTNMANKGKTQEGKELAVTDAKLWRQKRKEGFVIQLPSGNTARVTRKMDLIQLLQDGKLPNSLSKIVSALIAGEQLDTSNVGEKDVIEMMHWIDDQVIECMIEPQVLRKPDDADKDWEPPEGCIELADVDQMDRMFLAGIAQGGPASFEQFRRLSGSDVASL